MRFSFKNRIVTSFVAAVLILTAIAASVYVSFSRMARENAWVDHTYEVIGTLQDVLSDLKDVQSAQRGYVITGMEDYLAPYYIALPKIQQSLQDLAGMVSDNELQSKRFLQLKAHANERIDIADEIIKAYQTDGPQKASEMVRNGSGKREMDEIRFIVGEMVGEEKTLLDNRRDRLEQSAARTIVTGALGFAVCVTILLIVFAMIHRETRRRAAIEKDLSKTLNDVERLNGETQMLSRLGDYLRSCRSEEEAYEIIRGNMRELFPDTCGMVAIFNNSRNLLRAVLEWGDAPSSWEREYESDHCWALRQGRMHVADSDPKIPVCLHLVQETDGLRTVCVPMQAHGDIIGDMIFGMGVQPDERQLDLFRAVSEQISLALASLNLQRVLREQSIKDPLTKLYNRRYLEETFPRELARTHRMEQPLAVLMMDIDHFKKVNDAYGHDAGDAVLAAFAALLRQKSRKYDIPCRLGGEEFVLICPGASLEVGRKKAEDICIAARTMQIKHQNQVLNITVSIGVTAFPDHGDAPEMLLHQADTCLYQAKNEGRNRVVTCPPPAMSA